MKRLSAHMLLVVMTLSALFTSCSNKANKQADALEFDKTELKKSEHLFGETSNPACQLTLSLTYASKAATAGQKDSINTYLLSAALGSTYQSMAPDSALQVYAKNYISNYRNDLEPMLKKDMESEEDMETIKAWYSYNREIKTEVASCENNVLSYRIYFEEYTGGAHGIYQTTYLNLDLKNLMPIHLDDLFVDEYHEALTDLLWYQLIADKEVESREELEEMGYGTTGELAPVNNFTMDDEGITFYYNVYDIAPYVVGPTEIKLPYQLMEHLLSREVTN